ncbi:hypothetical protein [Streptomyces olivaceoviridis]|uniref:hypothetical protein n=1 Tax=Streptomyces olivaceoviridis TaxID=1921 RepID=UPI0036FDDE52
MRQRHVFGTVFTLEAVIAGGVFLVVLAVPAWSLPRRRARTAERSERPRVEAFHVGALAAFAVFLVAWTAWQNHEEHPADAAASTSSSPHPCSTSRRSAWSPPATPPPGSP